MHLNNIPDKINLDLDIYYNEPYQYNSSMYKIDSYDELNTIINNLTSIILNGCIKLPSELNSNDYLNLTSTSPTPTPTTTTLTTANINIFKLVANNQYDTLKKLLKKKSIDINVQDNDGDTPLHIAVFMSNDLICSLLLKYNANTTIKDKWGQTALHRICFCLDSDKLMKIVKLFIQYSDDLLKYNNFNQTDNFGNTPLHLVLKYLIKNQNSITAENIAIVRKLKIFTNCKITNKDNHSVNDLLNVLKLL